MKIPNTIEIEDKLEQFDKIRKKKNFDLPLNLNPGLVPKRHCQRGLMKSIAK